MTQTIEILLLSHASERICQWAQYLRGPAARVWKTPEDVPADVIIDAIVTDHAPCRDLIVCERLGRQLAGGEVGLVGVGWEDSVDVFLPDDLTARELQLACSLLAETVRLRRQANRNRRVQDELHDLAMTDSLTRLANRRAWGHRLARDPSASGDGVPQCSIALLDLDNFKLVNDRFGHLAGDRLLQLVAAQLASTENEFSFVARLGGDEFGVLFEGTPPAGVAAEIESLRIRACSDSPHRVTASIGLAVSSAPFVCDMSGPPSIENAHSRPATTRAERVEPEDAVNGISPLRMALLEAADRALRQAKASGRNRSVVLDISGSEDPQ